MKNTITGRMLQYYLEGRKELSLKELMIIIQNMFIDAFNKIVQLSVNEQMSRQIQKVFEDCVMYVIQEKQKMKPKTQDDINQLYQIVEQKMTEFIQQSSDISGISYEILEDLVDIDEESD